MANTVAECRKCWHRLSAWLCPMTVVVTFMVAAHRTGKI